MGTLTLSQIIFAFIWSFGASCATSFTFNTSKYDILWGGLIGAIGWGIYIILLDVTGSESESYFFGALAVAAGAEILAEVIKNPATVYLIPGLLPIVPGAGIFYMMRNVFSGDLESGLTTGYSTFIAAVAIAFGIATAASAARFIRLLRKHIR